MTPALAAYGFLAVAIAAEILGTTLMTASQQFTKLWPTIGMAVCYAIAFYMLTHTLKIITIGVAYAIWSGVGVAAIAIIGHFLFRQTLDVAGIIGITLIISGVVVLNLLSKTATH